MSQKRISFGEALDDLIEKTGLSEEPAFMEKSETNFQDELEANSGLTIFAGQSEPLLGINEPDFQYPYWQSVANSQAKEDVRQSNEIVAEMVVVGMNGCLVLLKGCRNNRWRTVSLTLKNHDFRVLAFQCNESQDEIIKIVLQADERIKEIYGKKSGIFSKKLYTKLCEAGVMFNLALNQRRQIDAICSFISQLAFNAVPRQIPLRHGWHKDEGGMIFCKSEEVWMSLEKKCVF